jgi:hypothetical protein
MRSRVGVFNRQREDPKREDPKINTISISLDTAAEELEVKGKTSSAINGYTHISKRRSVDCESYFYLSPNGTSKVSTGQDVKDASGWDCVG